MKQLYTAILFLLVSAGNAQVTLPGFAVGDTVTRICSWDTTTSVLTFTGWEAYQTVNGTWNGPVDSTICIDLAHVVGGSVQARIDFDDTDTSRPVFVRLLLDSSSAIPLPADDQFVFTCSGYPLSGTILDPGVLCPEGLCTGMQVAVRIPDSTGTGSDLRWYRSSYGAQMSEPFSVCVPTERFPDNALRELIIKFTLSSPGAGQQFRFLFTDAFDLLQNGNLVRLTEALLPQYQVSSTEYLIGSGFGLNYLVMYEDTTYPGPDHVSYLDFTPLPNVPAPTTVTVSLEPYSGFNFQPFTQLRGGAVLNNDSVFHNLTVVNNGAELCMAYQIAELIWGAGDRYVHQDGHLGFEGERSCFLFRRGSTLEVGAGTTLHYGVGNRGMLALNAGSDVVIGAGGELRMYGTLVLTEGSGAQIPQDLHTTLGPGAKLSFAPGAKVVNAFSMNGDMRWVIHVDGGAVDLSGLNEQDRRKIVVVQLPAEELTPLTIVPQQDGVLVQYATRTPGSGRLFVFDALGRSVVERSFVSSLGPDQLQLSTAGWRSGTYLLLLEINGERRAERWVKP